MTERSAHASSVVLLTFVAAYLLAVLPLPLWLMPARPEWLALALIYWTIALPHRVGILTGLLLGVVMDVLEGATIGQNALALVVVAVLALLLYQRLRVFSLWQQAAIVFVLTGIHQLLCQWVESLEGAAQNTSLFLLPALSSALLWPLILHTLRSLRRRFRVT